jgi:hypothetical protein
MLSLIRHIGVIHYIKLILIASFKVAIGTLLQHQSELVEQETEPWPLVAHF